MRKLLICIAVVLAAPISAYADIAVTYSQDSSERVCPANSYMIGSICQCSLGYVAKDNACVKPVTTPAPTPAELQIYREILMSITVNEKLTCTQLGWISATDAGMCSKYVASTDKSKWVAIDRPRIEPSSAVLNPWAPSSQQTMSEVMASTTVEPKTIPKPVATSTPVEPKPDDATLAEKALAELSAKLAESPPVPEPEAAPVVPSKPNAEPVPVETPNLDASPAQLAGAASAISDLMGTSTDVATTTEEGVQIYTGTLGLVPYEPAPTTDTSEEPAHGSLIGRIAAWLFSWF